jgi:serine/threonine protein phosphatase PrpC
MNRMSLLTQPAICLHQAVQSLEVGHDTLWQACASSRRDPFKSSPNEDSAAIIPCGENSVVIVVADGCGGTRGGDKASKLAIDYLVESIEQAFGDPRLLRGAILDGIENANHAIQSLKIGAACTIAVVEFHEGTIRSYHAGDSMILVTTNRGRIRYQSVCHSPIGYAVESGMLEADAAMHHEDRHLISNCVGSPQMRIEVGPTIELGKNDRVLVASDGLFDNLSIDEVVQHLRQGDLSKSTQKLADLASARMHDVVESNPSKPDDLTLVTLRRACDSIPKE